MNQKILKKERIRKKEEIKSILNKKRTREGINFRLYFSPNDLGFSRMAILTGKKIGKATKRNRVKRLFREAFRKNKYLFKDGLDILIIPKNSVSEKKYQEIEKDFIEVIKPLIRNSNNSLLNHPYC
ncbi:MAG: ribonuclease P protein component [Acidobacteriota bacterium]